MKAIAAHFRYIGRQGKEEAGGMGKTLEIESKFMRSRVVKCSNVSVGADRARRAGRRRAG